MITPPAYRRLMPTLYRLEGIQCEHCGGRAVARRATCPYCLSRSVSVRLMSGTGHIVAVTLVVKPPANHGRLGAYHLAIVALNDGPRVVARLADVGSRPPDVGAMVEVVFRRLYEPEAGDLICYGYKFRAVWKETYIEGPFNRLLREPWPPSPPLSSSSKAWRNDPAY